MSDEGIHYESSAEDKRGGRSHTPPMVLETRSVMHLEIGYGPGI